MTHFPPLAQLSDAEISAAAEAAGEPAWLVAQRVAAWTQFAASEPPIWKRTNLSKLSPETISAPVGAQSTTLTYDAAQLPAGVVFTTLAAALGTHEALIQQHLGQAVDPTTHKFSALHAALWQDGAFLYVPKNTAVELPLRATFGMPEGGNAIFPHSLIILERGASASFIEEYSSADREGQAFAAPATEIFLGDGAQLRFISAQTWGSGIYHIGAQRAKVGNDASLEWVALNLGGRLQHIEAETALAGNGSRVEWMASTFAQDGQSLLTAPWLRHIGGSTDGHMVFKTVVSGGGYTTFDGMIKIEKHSRATISRLEEHAIHLSPKARSDSIPGLMIDTNDVQRAGHASTSGQVDEEMLFYMRSRGIKHQDAIQLIVTGFFEPVLDRIPDEAVRERIAALIDAKI